MPSKPSVAGTGTGLATGVGSNWNATVSTPSQTALPFALQAAGLKFPRHEPTLASTSSSTNTSKKPPRPVTPASTEGVVTVLVGGKLASVLELAAGLEQLLPKLALQDAVALPEPLKRVGDGLNEIRKLELTVAEALPPSPALKLAETCASVKFSWFSVKTTPVNEHKVWDEKRITMIPGYFDKSLPAFDTSVFGRHTASVVHIDVDLHESTRQVLDFVTPFLH